MKVYSLQTIDCLLNIPGCRRECSKSRPFKTGTPFCTGHLRKVFGLAPHYLNTLIEAGSKKKRRYPGPYFRAHGFNIFQPGTIVLPKGPAIDDVLDGKTSNPEINDHTKEFLNELQANQSTEASVVKLRHYQRAIIRNWLEDPDDYQFDQKVAKSFDIEGLVRSRLEEWYSIINKSDIINKVASNCSILAVGAGYSPNPDNLKTNLEVGEMNPLLRKTCLHICQNERIHARDFTKGTDFYSVYYHIKLGWIATHSITEAIPLMQNAICRNVDLYESFFSYEKELNQSEIDRIQRGIDVDDFLEKNISRLAGVFNDSFQTKERDLNYC